MGYSTIILWRMLKATRHEKRQASCVNKKGRQLLVAAAGPVQVPEEDL